MDTKTCTNGHTMTGIGFDDQCPECEAPWIAMKETKECICPCHKETIDFISHEGCQHCLTSPQEEGMEDRLQKFLEMTTDILSDTGAGSFGKITMIKQEFKGFLKNEIALDRSRIKEEIEKLRKDCLHVPGQSSLANGLKVNDDLQFNAGLSAASKVISHE